MISLAMNILGDKDKSNLKYEFFRNYKFKLISVQHKSVEKEANQWRPLTIFRDFRKLIHLKTTINFWSIITCQCIFTYFQNQRSETNWNSETLFDFISTCTCIRKVLAFMSLVQQIHSLPSYLIWLYCNGHLFIKYFHLIYWELIS